MTEQEMMREVRRLRSIARADLLEYSMRYCLDITIKDMLNVYDALGDISVQEAKGALDNIQRLRHSV